MTIRDNLIAYGGVLKWPKRSVLKTERSLIATRGFNSLHLRHMPWNVMFQGFFLSVRLGYHSHTLAYATTTYHKRFHKSRDYSGLYGINLIIFCTVFSLFTAYQFLSLGIAKAVGISAHRFVLFIDFNQKQLSFINGYLGSLAGQDLIAYAVLITAFYLAIFKRILCIFNRDPFRYSRNVY